MKIRLDRLGRVVLPKPLRIRYGLKPGVELQVREDALEFSLRPVTLTPAMRQVQGIWVHEGVPQRDLDFSKILREDREDRLRHLAGTE